MTMTTISTEESALDAICRNALRLLGTAHGTPARLRIAVEGVSIDMEWPVAGTAAVGIPVITADLPDTGVVAPTGGFTILASSVGTFYRAPKPGAPPFVQVGEELMPGTQVGILEVMKLMIPVEADRHGRVLEVLVPDGTPVEHGQPLIACGPLDSQNGA
jgi:acetyl-CoA carboxylase biotin carboxyl carrier protein